jgi:hypothetical protein
MVTSVPEHPRTGLKEEMVGACAAPFPGKKNQKKRNKRRLKLAYCRIVLFPRSEKGDI